MRETIGQYANLAALLLFALAMIAVTVEAAAKNHGITAVICSPLAILLIVIAVVGWGLHFGWLK